MVREMEDTAEALSDEAKIVIAGAGAIGVYVGAKAAVNGRNVAFLGRERFVEAASQNGIGAIDPDGARVEASPSRFTASADPAVMDGAKVIYVAVRSRDTDEMAKSIRMHAGSDAIIVSLQNGVANAERLREALPGFDVRAGMVAYNVLLPEPNRAKRATGGSIFIEAGSPEGAARLLDAPGAPAAETADILSIQWGKVLLNLNNALNALSGDTLMGELMNPDWRKVLIACQTEALAALKAAGVKPVSAMGGVPPALLPHLMRLPNWLFKRVVSARMKISEDARSSMQNDLERRRPTEIDDLQGEVVRLAERVGKTAPMNALIMALIRDAESAGEGPPNLNPADILARFQTEQAPAPSDGQ